MADLPAYSKIEGSGKGPVIFGRDVSQIPCFRNSWLYGIGAGIFGGLMTFMGTSRPQLATKSGFVYLFGTTTAYWIYCRYNWMQEMKSAKVLQDYMRQHNEGDPVPFRPSDPRPPQPDLEIVTVGNKQ